jgi:hypothetical protein
VAAAGGGVNVAESKRATGGDPGRTAAATGQAARAARGPRAAAARASAERARSSAAHREPRENGDGSAADEPAQDGVCPVAFCPICTAVSVVNRASPDVVQHLLLAGQQFLMALKAVVDARAADFEEPGAEETPIQRIDIA